MTTQTGSTETLTNNREFLIVGRCSDGRYAKLGHLTPDIDIAPYLASLETAGYTDVHLAEQVTINRRVDAAFAEANRSTYPPQHAAMTKTTKSVSR